MQSSGQSQESQGGHEKDKEEEIRASKQEVTRKCTKGLSRVSRGSVVFQ